MKKKSFFCWGEGQSRFNLNNKKWNNETGKSNYKFNSNQYMNKPILYKTFKDRVNYIALS